MSSTLGMHRGKPCRGCGHRGSSPTSPQAAAQSTAATAASASSEARAHFERGVTLYDEADFPARWSNFAAYALAPTLQVLFNIGQSYFQLRDHAAALGTLSVSWTRGATDPRGANGAGPRESSPIWRSDGVRARHVQPGRRRGHHRRTRRRRDPAERARAGERGVRKISALIQAGSPSKGGLGARRRDGRRQLRLLRPPRLLPSQPSTDGARADHRRGRAAASIARPGPGLRRFGVAIAGATAGAMFGEPHAPGQITPRRGVPRQGVRPPSAVGHRRGLPRRDHLDRSHSVSWRPARRWCGLWFTATSSARRGKGHGFRVLADVRPSIGSARIRRGHF